MNITEFEQSYNIGYMARILMECMQTMKKLYGQMKELERLGVAEKELFELYHSVNRAEMRKKSYHPYLMEMALKLYKNTPEFKVGKENLRWGKEDGN